MLLCTYPPPLPFQPPLTHHPVCPCCSNGLTVSRSAPSDAFPLGQNRLECRTCPYQFLINQRYYERKEMKRKEVEDVMGGKDAWANVDNTDGMFDPWACEAVVGLIGVGSPMSARGL